MESHHHLQGLYPSALSDASMAALHHHQSAVSGHHHHHPHPGMHHLLATGQLKMDPHFAAHHHPFSINSIIAASSEAAAAVNAKAAADSKLYEMGYSTSYPSSISPASEASAAAAAASYYHHHPSAPFLYHTTST